VVRFGGHPSLAYSPNEEYLVVATSIGVELRQGDTYEIVRAFTSHTSYAASVAFSPD